MSLPRSIVMRWAQHESVHPSLLGEPVVDDPILRDVRVLQAYAEDDVASVRWVLENWGWPVAIDDVDREFYVDSIGGE